MSTISTLDLVTIQEAAAIIGVSNRRVQQFCEQGRLGQKVGNAYVIPRKEVVKFASKPREAGNPDFKR